MSFRRLFELYEIAWMFESHHHQRLAWEDAIQARLARDRAEAQALAQLRAMLDANPSGQLGDARLNDLDILKRSGLL
jgi:hypothetical protein